MEFYNTGYGHTFFNKQLPDLIKAINRLADVTEKLAEQNESLKEKDNNNG